MNRLEKAEAKRERKNAKRARDHKHLINTHLKYQKGNENDK